MPRHSRILVLRPDRIGDVVLATPLIRGLKERFPSASISVLVNPTTRDILRGNPHLDEILVDDPSGEHSGQRGFWQQVMMLRRRRFNTALLLLPTERLGWMLFFAGIRTRIGVGLKLYEALTFMRTVSRNKYIPNRHEADYCLDVGRLIGVKHNDLSVELFLSDDEHVRARKLLVDAGGVGGAILDEPLIGIHPGNSRSAPTWRVGRYAELAGMLLNDRDVRIVLTGSPQEAVMAKSFSHLDQNRIVNLMGKLSIRELTGVIAQFDIFVSSSTGPMHLAAGLKIPTVSMFCPLTACAPERWAPKGNDATILLPSADYCGRRCPGDPHICDFEGAFEIGQVANAVRQRIAKKKSTRMAKP